MRLREIPFWALPNVLSLDVALIGVAWQRLIAETLGTYCPPTTSWILGLSIWLAYMGDRWLDSIRLKEAHTYRHELMRILKFPFLALWILVLGIDIFLALHTLPHQNLITGSALLGLCILYTCSTQQGHHSPSLTKEFKVATIFSLGIFIFLIPANPFEWLSLSIYFGLLILLLWSNASMIAHWEHDADTQHRSASIATSHPELAAYAHWIALIVAALCLPLIAISAASTPFALACASSGICLFSINTLDCNRELRRVLADTALLTPLPMLCYV